MYIDYAVQCLNEIYIVGNNNISRMFIPNVKMTLSFIDLRLYNYVLKCDYGFVYIHI